jgi:hypothetical protein
MTTARSAVNALEAYGYSAKQLGQEVVTDCPTLLAVLAIQKRVGFADIDRVDLRGRTGPIGQTSQIGQIRSTAEFPSAPRGTPAEPGGELTGAPFGRSRARLTG